MGLIRVTTGRSEMGRSQCPMKRRMSASWGYPMEIAGLPCGKVGVTAWKFRGYPVENSGVTPSTSCRQLLAYVLHCLMVIDEFPRGERRLSAIGTQQSAKAKTMESRLIRTSQCAEQRKRG